MSPPPFELAIDEPLTRRQLLGASAGASAAIAAASFGLPAAAKALEAAAPAGLSAVQRADCLGVAQTVARRNGIPLSGRSPSEVVDALSDEYARAGRLYRDNVDGLLEVLGADGRRFAVLSPSAQEGFLRDELFPTGGPSHRSERLIAAVELVGHRLLNPELRCFPRTLAADIASELA